MSDYPSWEEMMNAVLATLHSLGGSVHRRELKSQALEHLRENGMPLSALDVPFKKGNKDRPRLDYHLDWALTYTKFLGLADNPQTGMWSLTQKGQGTHKIDSEDMERLRQIRKDRRISRRKATSKTAEATGDAEDPETWREELLDVLRNMHPEAFERLCRRILTESGFTQVKVTGKSGDGGIDGQGLIRIGGLISFPVLFQCKRFSGSVGPGIVRDFRGAMVGRANKGLILTTGYFTSEALKEATREGAEPIDLLDGDTLPDKIKELGLGVKIVEAVEVQRDWFEAI